MFNNVKFPIETLDVPCQHLLLTELEPSFSVLAYDVASHLSGIIWNDFLQYLLLKVTYSIIKILLLRCELKSPVPVSPNRLHSG